MTKALDQTKHKHHCKGLGMIDKLLWSGSVVKVKSTDSTDTLKPNPNGDKPLEPLDRAQKTVMNEYRKPQNH